MEVMYAEIIKIGNSKGLRIPKTILNQCNIKEAVDIAIQDGTLIITPYKDVRVGWEDSFRLMAQNGDDELLDAEYVYNADDEWQWE